MANIISLKISARSLINGLQNSTADLHTLPRQTSCFLPHTGSIATVSDVWEVDQDVVVGTMDTMDTCLCDSYNVIDNYVIIRRCTDTGEVKGDMSS